MFIIARTMGFEPTISAVTGQRFKPAKLRPHTNFVAVVGLEPDDLGLMKTLL